MNGNLERLIRKKNLKDADYSIIGKSPTLPLKSIRLNIVGLGDVGLNLVLGLKLLAGDTISEIGLCSRKKEAASRLEMEFNQIYDSFSKMDTPEIKIIEEKNIMDCDVFVFAASAGVPKIGTENKVDVRMIQLEENSKLVGYYGKLAVKEGFEGLFIVVSDPVDQLCLSLYEQTNKDDSGNWTKKGLSPYSIKGYGLGVMNARALYYSKNYAMAQNYKNEGRAFGPHGKGLVIANSIEKYDEITSINLTQNALEANLKVRELGYKPFYAPAISSGAYSILATLRNQWHYSNVYIDGHYLGIKNRIFNNAIQVEKLFMSDELYKRIKNIWW